MAGGAAEPDPGADGPLGGRWSGSAPLRWIAGAAEGVGWVGLLVTLVVATGVGAWWHRRRRARMDA